MGWLSVIQQAAYCTVRIGIQILQRKVPERLYAAITGEQAGHRVRKELTEDELRRLKLSTMKSWSVRALRWMAMMNQEMLNMDTTTKQSKESLKSWIKHRVPVRGDKVFWGKLVTPERGLGGHQGGGQGGGNNEPQDPGGNEGDRNAIPEGRGEERLRSVEAQQGLDAVGAGLGTLLARQLVGTTKTKVTVKTRGPTKDSSVLPHWLRQAGCRKMYKKRGKITRDNNGTTQNRQDED